MVISFRHAQSCIRMLRPLSGRGRGDMLPKELAVLATIMRLRLRTLDQWLRRQWVPRCARTSELPFRTRTIKKSEGSGTGVVITWTATSCGCTTSRGRIFALGGTCCRHMSTVVNSLVAMWRKNHETIARTFLVRGLAHTIPHVLSPKDSSPAARARAPTRRAGPALAVDMVNSLPGRAKTGQNMRAARGSAPAVVRAGFDFGQQKGTSGSAVMFPRQHTRS